jgi:hypothetical protein
MWGISWEMLGLKAWINYLGTIEKKETCNGLHNVSEM